jgi:hypothetical protein
MAHRWLASVLLYAEKSFHAVNGHEHIKAVLVNIELDQATISLSYIALKIGHSKDFQPIF